MPQRSGSLWLAEGVLIPKRGGLPPLLLRKNPNHDSIDSRLTFPGHCPVGKVILAGGCSAYPQKSHFKNHSPAQHGQDIYALFHDPVFYADAEAQLDPSCARMKKKKKKKKNKEEEEE